MKKRIFIAINLPENVKKPYAHKVNELEAKFKGLPIKWVRAENLHLTLSFLGWVEEEKISEVKEIVKEIAEKNSPFEIILSGLGGFPNQNNPRVIWVGVSSVILGNGATPESPLRQGFEGQADSGQACLPDRQAGMTNNILLKISEELKNKLKQAGIEQDEREFSTHLTLARVKDHIKKPEVEKIFKALIDLPELKFTASSIDIMESVLRRDGPEYKILASIMLSS